MKKSLLLVLLIPLALQTLQAQTPMMYEQEALKMLNGKMHQANLDNRSSDYPRDFDKNSLAFKNWHYGKIYFNDNTDMDSMRFNFDFNINAIVVQFNLDISAISLKPGLVESFILYDNVIERQFVRKTEGDFESVKFQMPYFEVILGNDTNDQLTILKQYQKELYSAQSQVNYGGEVAQDKYDFRQVYFIKSKGEKTYSKFGLTKKKMLGLFDKAKSKEVLNHVRSNGIKWGDEFEMMKVLKEFMQQ